MYIQNLFYLWIHPARLHAISRTIAHTTPTYIEPISLVFYSICTVGYNLMSSFTPWFLFPVGKRNSRLVRLELYIKQIHYGTLTWKHIHNFLNDWGWIFWMIQVVTPIQTKTITYKKHVNMILTHRISCPGYTIRENSPGISSRSCSKCQTPWLYSRSNPASMKIYLNKKN